MPFQRSFFRRARSGKVPADALAPQTLESSPIETTVSEFLPLAANGDEKNGKKGKEDDNFNDFSDKVSETAAPTPDLNDIAEIAPSSQYSSDALAERPAFVLEDGRIDWGAALRANEGWLRATIAARVGESAAVDEVFQEVALAATRQKSPIQDPRKIGAWLFRLASTYSLLYRRSVGRQKKALQKYEETLPPLESDARQLEPLHWLLLEERRACVRRATALLPADEREILALKYAEGKSYKEIAEKIGLTVSAVQSKLFRARARLKEKLTQFLPESEGVF